MYRPTHIAAIPPTVNDDLSLDFHKGNYWWDTATQTEYILEDETIGAADWVVVSGGGTSAWANWIPVFTWVGGVPATTYVARYQTVNNTVFFTLLIQAANASGSSATSVSATLPVTPKDNDTFLPIYAMYAMSALTSKADIYGTMLFLIDAYDNATRKLYCIPNFTLANGSTWTWIMEGFYETT